MKIRNPKSEIRNRGQAVILVAVLFLVGTLIAVQLIFSPVFRDAQRHVVRFDSKQSYALAEAGLEDAMYRTKQGMELDTTEVLTAHRTHATTTVTDAGGRKRITAIGNTFARIRRIVGVLVEGDGVAFNYGVQAGEGGFELQNSARIVGNAFSNGPIRGAGNEIGGDVISAGPDGLMEDIHATGTVYADTIRDSHIDKDAYYETIENTIVEGTPHPDSEPLATSALPISDETVQEWEDNAADGGTLACSNGDEHIIDGSDTIGPVKIPCDLKLQNADLTVAGAVWVVGDITVQNQTTISVDSSASGTSIPIIADNPDFPADSARIEIQNRSEFHGAGDDSHILLLSMNESAEQGGGNDAINIQNRAEGDLLLYAGHGRIRLQNRVSLREVTAWEVHAQNRAEVIYSSGLANTLFTTGPSGGFTIESWGEE